MKDYLLFMDTESSGLPKKWDAPYSQEGNWPHVVQFSWTVYSREGRLVKQENHYIGEQDFSIDADSAKIHGITRDFLDMNGKSRKEVMELLTKDLEDFEPLIIGHFVDLDLHLAGAEYYRLGMENPLPSLPSFCTMQATRHLVRNPRQKFLRLGDLYERLFQQELTNQHNAMTDVNATAQCFFELLRSNEISESSVDQQKEQILKAQKMARTTGWSLFAFMICLLSVLIAYFI